MVTRLVGASPSDQKLYEHLSSHEQNESELLLEYQDAATSSQSSAFRYLCALILEDEVRHHRVFGELASSLRHEAELRREEPVVPRLVTWGPDAAHVVQLTEKLLAQERSDSKELKRLAAELKDVKDFTLWQLLVKLMVMDTAKHIEILEFVRRHARK